MPDNHSSATLSREALARRHEPHDPHLRNVLIIIASVIFMLVLCLCGTGVLIQALSRARPRQAMEPLGIIHAPNLRPLTRFPGPTLEIDDGHADWAALHQAQTNRLESYGWVDRSQGIVRVPIERAMDLLLQHGLPARTNDIAASGVSALQLIQERPAQR